MGPVDYITRIRDNYARLGYKAYNWAINRDPAPWAPLRKPLSQCRLGLAASGGIYVAGQVAFHYKDDTSLREIPTDIDTKELRATHFAYDLSDARTDPNVVFPIDTLRRLVREGFLGALESRFHTLTAPGSMRELPFRWPEDEEWKAKAYAEGDERTPRHDTPQYQDEADRRRAEQGNSSSCPVCLS